MLIASSQTLAKGQDRLAPKAARPRIVGPGLPGFAILTLVFALSITASFAMAVEQWHIPAIIVAGLILINALWISGGAATALLGLLSKRVMVIDAPRAWVPQNRTAILITVCGEDIAPLARYLASFANGLKTAGIADHTRVFVLSDTSGADQIKDEQQALAGLIDAGQISYRRRIANTRKKPGNIADWLTAEGENFDFMLVKDADSRMSVHCTRNLIWGLEQRPQTGLLQAAIAMVPGRTRFGRHQRVSSRLLGRIFGRGFVAASGKAGNYWGHNAIMRIKAFRAAAHLPQLPGKAPFGGDILSHDFVEAAWMRRAGWDIELATEVGGSAEDAPQTMHEFFRRDRRWCQGNLQHLRICTAAGLHPLSRLHLIMGAFSYLSAPILLILLALLSFGVVSVTHYGAILVVAIVLFIPKLCALADRLPAARTGQRRRVILRAWLSELGLSTLVGPLISLRHSAAVLSICMGRDCGWKSGRRGTWRLPAGWPEAAAGLAILLLALNSQAISALWLAPIFGPLIMAPVLIPLLDGEPA
ncbi:glucans biosynthesis glucosyltransferase MdoH [Yoonia sp. BS5-3]|uniref:Glucans biosynthesis glucosyltransferase H n=1 Tax=Yoonia phaeophyticola TaxID=3137369 RepID=A0ABZ2V6T7_9RHOB